MYLLFIALMQSATAKSPDLSQLASITVDYTMESSGTISCVTVFKGTGTAPAVDGDRVTFTGTWEIVSDTCNGATVWAPAEDDKTAHHTLRLGKKGVLDEWVVHREADDHERFQSNIKDRGQYWINELGADLSASSVEYSTQEKQGVGPLTITIDHKLKLDIARSESK